MGTPDLERGDQNVIASRLGSEDVGVEPNAGISSVRYQGVESLRGTDHGDTFRTLKT